MHFHTPTNSSDIRYPTEPQIFKSESKDKTPSKLLCSLNSDHSEI